jgi:hypothetical protein
MRTHPDDGALQQSELAVQRAPSETHPPHASVCGDGTQCVEQHSDPTAQAPLVEHVAGCSQRCDAPSVVHVNALQHCGVPVQSSPSPPQLDVLGAQRFTLLASATHEPEQQSASVSQRSHCTVQPPIGAQRFVPSVVTAHERVAQSCGFAHTSPMSLFPGLPSFAGHACAVTQRFEALHVPEQQSAPDAQISPTTRHASSSAQRLFVQTCPQQSPGPLHMSPAGWHPGAFAHVPLLQMFEQQSVGCEHFAFAIAHVELVQVPLVPSGAKHPSEQHAAAKEHDCPTPRQPVVGRHVCSENESSAHNPEQQSADVPHRTPTGEHVVASASLPSTGGADSVLASTPGVSTSSETVSQAKRKPHDMKVPQAMRNGSRIRRCPKVRGSPTRPHRTRR